MRQLYASLMQAVSFLTTSSGYRVNKSVRYGHCNCRCGDLAALPRLAARFFLVLTLVLLYADAAVAQFSPFTADEEKTIDLVCRQQYRAAIPLIECNLKKRVERERGSGMYDHSIERNVHLLVGCYKAINRIDLAEKVLQDRIKELSHYDDTANPHHPLEDCVVNLAVLKTECKSTTEATLLWQRAHELENRHEHK